MSEDDFWALINSSISKGTKAERVHWLQCRLVETSPEEIIDFHSWMFLTLQRAETWNLIHAAGRLFWIPSEESFVYFARWLIGLGREAFESVVANPDNLIDLDEVRDLIQYRRSGGTFSNELYPEFEMLGYVAIDAYVQVAKKDARSLWEALEAKGIDVFGSFNPKGEPWDDLEEAQWRLPRIHQYLAEME
ncbi:DUF4240 domain-containing protein [Nonomuraea sp. JJY05]|uniref:DUF4240 domain-containing protein n=1 Tax=Nonomuraea sp. JJY05 TaxID=3350255 RepID=UPI00373E9BA6